jgi:hypothetical protein
MSFNQAYSELLAMLPASIKQEVWVRLTTWKRNPLSVSEASGVNPEVKSFLQYEALRYQKKLSCQRQIKSWLTLSVNQMHMEEVERDEYKLDVRVNEGIAFLQKRLLEYNRDTFGQLMQDLIKTYESQVKANQEMCYEIEKMKAQVVEAKSLLDFLKSKSIKALGAHPNPI